MQNRATGRVVSTNSDSNIDLDIPPPPPEPISPPISSPIQAQTARATSLPTFPLEIVMETDPNVVIQIIECTNVNTLKEVRAILNEVKSLLI